MEKIPKNQQKIWTLKTCWFEFLLNFHILFCDFLLIIQREKHQKNSKKLLKINLKISKNYQNYQLYNYNFSWFFGIFYNFLWLFSLIFQSGKTVKNSKKNFKFIKKYLKIGKKIHYLITIFPDFLVFLWFLWLFSFISKREKQ